MYNVNFWGQLLCLWLNWLHPKFPKTWHDVARFSVAGISSFATCNGFCNGACDSSMARPARHSTARESPQLATTKEDAVTQQTTWSDGERRGATVNAQYRAAKSLRKSSKDFETEQFPLSQHPSTCCNKFGWNIVENAWPLDSDKLVRCWGFTSFYNIGLSDSAWSSIPHPHPPPYVTLCGRLQTRWYCQQWHCTWAGTAVVPMPSADCRLILELRGAALSRMISSHPKSSHVMWCTRNNMYHLDCDGGTIWHVHRCGPRRAILWTFRCEYLDEKHVSVMNPSICTLVNCLLIDFASDESLTMDGGLHMKRGVHSWHQKATWKFWTRPFNDHVWILYIISNLIFEWIPSFQALIFLLTIFLVVIFQCTVVWFRFSVFVKHLPANCQTPIRLFSSLRPEGSFRSWSISTNSVEKENLYFCTWSK